MRLSIKTKIITLSVFGFFSLLIFTHSAKAADGDISAVRVLGNTCTATTTTCNGFIAEMDILGVSTGGTYDFGFNATTSSGQIDSNAKLKLTISSPGFDSSGNSTTTTRSVYGTRWLRKPYPSQTTADETAGGGYTTVRVVLSEFVYSGETVTATVGAGLYTQGGTPNNAATGISVTNDSTYSYPKPVGRWVWVPYERVTSNFLIEAAIFHRFARNGKPVAAVVFTCTDESSNTSSQTVTDMTVSTRTGDANSVLVYAATMPIAGFTQGDVITCNFTAYPWVGNSSSLLKSDLVANGGDGFAQPEDRLGPFALLNDKAGTYGTPCVVVASTGQASTATTWVYSSCAAAEAAYAGDNTLAYSDIGYASRAIKAYNNANHGHNDPGGGTIELLNQNYTNPGTASSVTLGTQETWLTIQPASSVSCQTPVINANSNNELMAQKLKYSCISTLTTTGNIFHGDESYNDILWLDQMKLNSTESGWSRYWKTAFATRNTIDALPSMGLTSFSTTRSSWGLIRGNTYTPLLTASGTPAAAEFYNVIGNKNLRMTARTNTVDSRNISDNAIWAFNSTYNDTNSNPTINVSGASSTVFSHGMAIVQNVIETVNNSGVQPNVALENMGGTESINNLIYWHNVSRGQRSNVAYAADAARCSQPQPFFSNWSWKYNADSNNNRIDEDRADHGCAADSNRTGNWSMTFMVGAAGNALAVGGGPSWSEPDYWGLYSTSTPGTTGFTSDLSGTGYGGSGGGNGNYRLTQSSTLRTIVPAGAAVLPYDLEGNARHNNGYGALGAYEWDTTAPTVTAFVIPSTATSLTVSITTFTATDSVGIAGYKLTESSTAPAYDASGWSSSATTTYTFASAGAKTLYAWAKDEVGNVSSSQTDSVTITLPTYTVGGTVSGLTGNLTLQNNSGDDLNLSSSGSFVFATSLSDGASYSVTVSSQPSGQTCTVSSGSGTVSSSNVSDVSVACASSGSGGGGGGTVSNPYISDIGVLPNTASSVFISWKTAYPSQSEVLFGTSTLLGQVKKSAGDGLNHKILLENLFLKTKYHFKIKAQNGGLVSESGYFSFDTSNENLQPSPNPESAPSLGQASEKISLVYVGKTIYVVKGGQRYGVESPAVLFSHGFEFKDARPASVSETQLHEGGVITVADGALIKTANNPTIHLVSGRVKNGFASMGVFRALGFNLKNVFVVSESQVKSLPEGQVLNDTLAPHLPGVNVVIDGTVYWVGPGVKLHGYPSLDIYNSWHTDNDFSFTVLGNQADRSLPMGDNVSLRLFE